MGTSTASAAHPSRRPRCGLLRVRYDVERRRALSGGRFHRHQHRPIGDLLALLHRDRLDPGIQHGLELVLDLHCDNDAVLHLYSEEACWPTIEPLAATLGCRAVLLAKNSGGGPFDERLSGLWWQLRERLIAAGVDKPLPQGCASTTVELRGEADVDHAHAQIDAVWCQCVQNSELLSHFERRVMRQHHPCTANANTLRLRGNGRHQNFGRCAHDAGMRMVLANPKSRVAKSLGRLR